MFRISVLLFVSIFCFVPGFAQNGRTLQGVINQEEDNIPVPTASVYLKRNNTIIGTATTGSAGNFTFARVVPGSYLLEAKKPGFETSILILNVTATDPSEPIVITITKIAFESEEVVVEAFRASASTPVTQSTLTQKYIEANYVGHDIPMLINNTPSINAYSDAGNGMGYSSFRLRGMEPTRINMTVNGVPINDAETQGFFTNNFADLASSAAEIQIQRGVGTSGNGTAAFGGSLNIITQHLDKTASVEVNTGIGSFGSRRNTVEFQSGRLADGKIAFYGRLSDLSSDGYRQHSATHNQTYFFSAGWFGRKSLLKFNAWGGVSQSQLAYVAIDEATLENNRRYNPLSPEERDEFRQHFYQVQYTHHISSRLNVSASGYYVRGDAPKFDYLWYGAGFDMLNAPADTLVRGTDTITTTDFMARYRLDQQFWGGFASLNYSTNKLHVSVGLHANKFVSDHYNQVAWAQIAPGGIQPGHIWYFNTGTKQEMSAFLKADYKIGRFILFADLQVRQAKWRYEARKMEYNTTDYNVEPMSWAFFNPKVGTRYGVGKKVSVYAHAGVVEREPTRIDYLRDDLAWRELHQGDVRTEIVLDIELGATFSTKNLWLNANIYNMSFVNQITNTGIVNQFGVGITDNVSNSTRIGIEIDGKWQVLPRLALTHASSFSQNNISFYNQYYTVTNQPPNTFSTPYKTFEDVQPALSPQAIINQGIEYTPLPFVSLAVSGRYVGKQYIDNTENENLSIPAYTVADATLALHLQQWTKTGEQTLSLRVNNFTNTLYSPSGAVAGGSQTMMYDTNGQLKVTSTAAFFPAATANFFVTLMVRF